jgi:hypothetical protein
MLRPVMIPWRWTGHGLDIRTCITDGQTLFLADDICKALDLVVDVEHDTFMDVDIRTYPAPTVEVDGLVDENQQPRQFFTTAIVYALADERPMYIADDHGEFIEWIDELLNTVLTEDRLEQVVDAALPEEPGRAAGESYSVAKAAKILSRDPALDYGQQTLFAALQDSLGWITREAGVWVPSKASLQNGYLVRMTRRWPGQTELYRQVRLTPDGLKHLHERLGGVAALNLDAPVQPTLIEVP